jgi:iron complex transport system permease protein
LLLQSLLILVMGMHSLVLLGQNGNFALSIALMLAYSWAIHYWLFQGWQNNVYFLLLLGFVLTMVIGTFTQFIQLRISPGEFAILQGFSQASFNKAQPVQLLYSAVLAGAACVAIVTTLPALDVLALGREQAIARYRLPAHGAAAAGADRRARGGIDELAGPTAFMGIFVANTTYALARTDATAPPCRWAVPSPSPSSSSPSCWSNTFSITGPPSASSSTSCVARISSLMVRTRGTA